MLLNRVPLAYRFGLILLLLGMFWLAARQMAADPIWYDEYWSLYYAGAAPQYGPIGLPQTWARVAGVSHELNPPGYYLLLHGWGTLAGGTPFAARALSGYIGLLAAAWAYRAGSAVGGRGAGVGTAVALAGSAFYSHYLHEIRAYALLPLLIFMTLWAYHQYLRRGGGRRAALLLFSLTALLYTHYMALPFVLAAAVYHAAAAPRNRRWLGAAAAAAGAGLLFLPWAGVALSALQYATTDPARSFYASDAPGLVHLALTAFTNHNVALWAVFAWYGLRQRGAALVGPVLLLTLALTLLINERFRFISGAHYLMALLPLMALVVGLGTARMARLRLRPLILLLVWIAAGVALALNPAARRAPDDWQLTLPWDALAAALRPYQQPDAAAIYFLPAPVPHWIHAPVAAYYLADLPAQVTPMPSFVVPPGNVPDSGVMRLHLVESLADKAPDAYQQEARALLRPLDAVWLAHHPTFPPGVFTRPAFEAALAEQGFSACTQVVADPALALTLFARWPDRAPQLRFGEAIDLDLLLPVPETVRDHLVLALGWRLDDAVPRGTYSVAAHIENAQGQLVAQRDMGLPDAPRACQPLSVPLTGLPPGQYQARVMVYNWQTGERLGAGADDRPLIGAFTLE